MVKILHFADFHLGMENYGRPDSGNGLNSRVNDFLQRLDETVEFACTNEADLILFAGDAFKNRLPNPTLQRAFALRVRKMAELCPVVLLVGNHDLPATVQRASSLDIYDTLAVPNVIVGDVYDVFPIETRSGPIYVATAPYPIRSRLLTDEETHGMTMAQIDARVQAALQTVLAELADMVRQAAPDDVPRVLVGHFSVSGALFSSERNVMVGRDASVLLGELDDAVWDYVALGHIHKHQNLTAGRRGAPPVVYSGSMERIDFGEEQEPKGFCWVEVERGAVQWEFVPLSSRPFVTLRADVRGHADPMGALLDLIQNTDLEQAVVRVLIDADMQSAPLLKESQIYAALRAAGADWIAAVRKEVERPTRYRLGGHVDGLTPLQLLERYFQANEMKPEQIAMLLERAEPLLSEVGD